VTSDYDPRSALIRHLTLAKHKTNGFYDNFFRIDAS